MPADRRGPDAPDQSYPKACRLRRRSEYQVLQQHGHRFPTRDLIILSQPGRAERTRLGVTVSKRVAKQATRRNRIKRWIREAFRLLPDRSEGPPLDIVVIARGQAVHTAYAEVRAQLASFWRKARSRRGPRSSG